MTLKKMIGVATMSAVVAGFGLEQQAVAADYVDIGLLPPEEAVEVADADTVSTKVLVQIAPVDPVFIETVALDTLVDAPVVEASDAIVYTNTVESRVEAFRRAMIQADVKVLSELADDDLNFGHSNGVVQSKQDFIDMVRNGDEVFTTLDLTDRSIQTAGNLSMERHVFTSDIIIKGETISVELQVLEVWRDGPSGWRLVGRQAFKI